VARLDQYRYSRNGIALLLWPLSLVFGLVAGARRLAYRLRLRRPQRFPVPVVVVGDITVGGSGKTPLVIWLAGYLRQRGMRPGIVSRGYGGRARHWPQQVRADSDPATVGDEAVMLAARTACPMCVGPDRSAAVEALLEHTDINVIISDDGMQDYALARDLEIAVIDGERRFGNGFLLPAGPLREPRSRLESVDLVIANGRGQQGEFSMKVHQPAIRGLNNDDLVELSSWAGQSAHAVAGVSNPRRFFELLERYGLEVDPHAFPDHHPYRPEDLAFDDGQPVLMTEKDAVKCRRLPCRNCWVVQLAVQPDAAFVLRVDLALKEIVDGQETAGHPGLPDL
jgi:tetraacyldisaccharide 4'-kinase